MNRKFTTSLALLLVTILLVLSPTVAMAETQTDTIKFPVHFEFPDNDPCSGKHVWVVGDGTMVMHTSANENSTHVNTTLIWENSVTEMGTGEFISADHGVIKDVVNLNRANTTRANNFIASGKTADGYSWHMTMVMRYNLNADGKVTVDLTHSTLHCP